MTLTELINSCPATVTDAAGVVSSINWFAQVEAFALEKTLEELPNKHPIINCADIAFLNTKIGTTEYGDVNDHLTHVKGLLTAANSI